MLAEWRAIFMHVIINSSWDICGDVNKNTSI